MAMIALPTWLASKQVTTVIGVADAVRSAFNPMAGPLQFLRQSPRAEV